MYSIRKMNCQQLLEHQEKFTSEYIRKLQKEYDDSKYPVKSENDKLKCQICRGKYTRRNKSVHDKTKTHRDIVNKLYEWNIQHTITSLCEL